MHLDYIIGDEDTEFPGMLRSYLDEPVDEASDWDQSELVEYVNLEHRHLFSVIRNYNEDWFGRYVLIPLVSGQFEYYLPLDCVTVRCVEIVNAAAVTGSAPFFVVDELNSGAQEVGEVDLSNKDAPYMFTRSTGFRFGTGYYLFDDQLVFQPNQQIGSQYYVRLYYLPSAPDLHRGKAQAGAAGSITLGADAAAETVGYIRTIDNYYKGMRIEIIDGTGAGQTRRISKYVGSTRIADVDSAWSTTPDNTSIYSIVSPIKEDFQELLILGGALRAKGIKVEDDTTGIGAIYSALRTDMDNSLDQRNHQRNRRVTSRGGD